MDKKRKKTKKRTMMIEVRWSLDGKSQKKKRME